MHGAGRIEFNCIKSPLRKEKSETSEKGHQKMIVIYNIPHLSKK